MLGFEPGAGWTGRRQSRARSAKSTQSWFKVRSNDPLWITSVVRAVACLLPLCDHKPDVAGGWLWTCRLSDDCRAAQLKSRAAGALQPSVLGKGDVDVEAQGTLAAVVQETDQRRGP